MSDPKPLLPCPFCGKAMMLRGALWPSEGDRDAVIHAEPTDCPLYDFANDTFDGSIVEVWNHRASPTAQTGEAVAWLYDFVDVMTGDTIQRVSIREQPPSIRRVSNVRPLYTHPAPAVPDAVEADLLAEGNAWYSAVQLEEIKLAVSTEIRRAVAWLDQHEWEKARLRLQCASAALAASPAPVPDAVEALRQIRKLSGLDDALSEGANALVMSRMADIHQHADAALAASHMPVGDGYEPYLWQCKDYADGWITYTDREEALAYQRDTGCLLRITYRPLAASTGEAGRG